MSISNVNSIKVPFLSCFSNERIELFFRVCSSKLFLRAFHWVISCQVQIWWVSYRPLITLSSHHSLSALNFPHNPCPLDLPCFFRDSILVVIEGALLHIWLLRTFLWHFHNHFPFLYLLIESFRTCLLCILSRPVATNASTDRNTNHN